MFSIVALMTVGMIAVQIIYVSPTRSAAYLNIEARNNLEQARRAGKEHGEKRRQELKKWVEEGGMKGMGTEIGHGKRPGAGVRIRDRDSELDADD